MVHPMTVAVMMVVMLLRDWSSAGASRGGHRWRMGEAETGRQRWRLSGRFSEILELRNMFNLLRIGV